MADFYAVRAKSLSLFMTNRMLREEDEIFVGVCVFMVSANSICVNANSSRNVSI